MLLLQSENLFLFIVSEVALRWRMCFGDRYGHCTPRAGSSVWGALEPPERGSKVFWVSEKSDCASPSTLKECAGNHHYPLLPSFTTGTPSLLWGRPCWEGPTCQVESQLAVKANASISQEREVPGRGHRQRERPVGPHSPISFWGTLEGGLPTSETLPGNMELNVGEDEMTSKSQDLPQPPPRPFLHLRPVPSSVG